MARRSVLRVLLLALLSLSVEGANIALGDSHSGSPFNDCVLLGSDVGIDTHNNDVVVYGDLDGDGRTDLLAKTSSMSYKVYKQTSLRTFGHSIEVMNSMVGASSKICELTGPLDLDKDGIHDMIFLDISPQVHFGTIGTNEAGKIDVRDLGAARLIIVSSTISTATGSWISS